MIQLRLVMVAWLSFFILLVTPGKVEAELFLSEIYPAPLSGESEWVELCNAGLEPMQLSGYYLMDVLTTPSTIYAFSNEVIPASSAVVVTLSSAKLNNAADGVTLFSGPQQVVDQVNFSTAQNGLSFSRTIVSDPMTMGTPHPGLCLPKHFPPTPTPTPTLTPSSTPSPTPTALPTPTRSISPTASPPNPTPSFITTPTTTPVSFDPALLPQLLEISEIQSCPESGEPEWIELHALTNQEVDLQSWYFLDAAANRVPLSLRVAPNSYNKLNLPSAIINNSGDSLNLYSPDQIARLSAQFGQCQAGLSFQKTSAGQYNSFLPTPEKLNEFLLPSNQITVTPTPSRPVTASTQSSSVNSNPDRNEPLQSGITSPTTPTHSQVLGVQTSPNQPFLPKLVSLSDAEQTGEPPPQHYTHIQDNLPVELLLSASLGGCLMVSSAVGIWYGIFQNYRYFTL